MAKEKTGWLAWGYLAAILMVLGGVFQSMFGLIAIFNHDFLVFTSGNIWVLDVATWGWIHLGIGVVLALAGLALFTGSMWGRALAIIVASLSAIANFLFIPVYPIWSLVVMVIDILIIYAVAAHGGEAMEE